MIRERMVWLLKSALDWIGLDWIGFGEHGRWWKGMGGDLGSVDG